MSNKKPRRERTASQKLKIVLAAWRGDIDLTLKRA